MTFNVNSLISSTFTSFTKSMLKGKEKVYFNIQQGNGYTHLYDGTLLNAANHSNADILFIQNTFRRLDKIIDLDFKRTTNYANSHLDFTCFTDHEGGSGLLGRVHDNQDSAGAKWWDITWQDTDGVSTLNSTDKNTIIHEIGHALGLSHPDENPNNPHLNDDHTVMSYNTGESGPETWFSANDIKALIKIWGREDDHIGKTITGRTTRSNILKGTAKDDKITGGYKNDSLTGNSGNDTLYGNVGNDTINGGSGRDTSQFSSRSNRINLNTTRWQNTGDGKDRLISIENVNAGSGSDVVTGNRSANTLNGQAGNDRLYGGSGNDLLIGGGGKDRVWGQGGRDTFRVQRGGGYTIVEDFTNGQDKIHLGSGASGLKMVNRGGDAYLYQRGDLMAVIEDAAGDLQRSGSYLV